MNLYSIILAGGVGSRLSPISTPKQPKQFHDLLGNGKTLLQETVLRANEFTKLHRIYTIGNIHHYPLMCRQLRKIDYSLTKRIIFEPKLNNTAASVFLAARIIKKGVMIIIPSDHYISGNFKSAALEAKKLAENGKIVTFGIKPTNPNPNYGYILKDKFVEKPKPHAAGKLIEQGALWNSGIFVVEAENLLREYEKYIPEFFGASFTNMPRLPFDRAIMEKTDKLHCLEASFNWDDLGSWESLARYNPELAYKYAS